VGIFVKHLSLRCKYRTTKIQICSGLATVAFLSEDVDVYVWFFVSIFTFLLQLRRKHSSSLLLMFPLFEDRSLLILSSVGMFRWCNESTFWRKLKYTSLSNLASFLHERRPWHRLAVEFVHFVATPLDFPIIRHQ